MDVIHLNLKYNRFCIMLQIDSRAFAEFVLARLDLVKIEKHLMQRSKVLFGRSVVIRVHWVCLWIFLGSSNHFYLPIDVFSIIYLSLV